MSSPGMVTRTRDIVEVRLPSSDYFVSSWKVQAGAAVRQGETIAFLTRLGSLEGGGSRNVSTSGVPDVTASAATAAPKYKRPTKRRRPGPTQSHSLSSSSTAKSDTLKPDCLPAKNNGSARDQTKTMKEVALKYLPTMSSGKNSSVSTSSNGVGFETETNLLHPGTVPLLASADGIIQLEAPRSSPGSTNDRNAEALVVARIVPCEHPTVVDNLCVVCGKDVGPNAAPPISLSQALHQSTQASMDANTTKPESSAVAPSRVTVSGGVTMTVSASEGQRMAQEDALRLQEQRKLSLVLDLDHTLLHATSDERARRHLGRSDVRSLALSVAWERPPGTAPPAETNVTYLHHFVKLRPHLREFFDKVMPLYEVGVYTAGTRQYAQEITMLIARHLLGSKYDATDLPALYRKRDLLQRQVQLWKERKVSEDASATGSTVGANGKGDEEESKSADPSPATKSTTGKRKVRFGDTSEKTDERSSAERLADSEAQLELCLNELAEAEQSEREVTAFRQRLFANRIVSRTDVADLGINVKSLKRIFPCGGTMAVVVDDREDVWANSIDNETKGEPPENMLLVKPYHWGPFAGFADVNNTSGDDFGAEKEKKNKSLADDDRQLSRMAEVLQQIHGAFYEIGHEAPQPGRRTVPEIVRDMRQQILSDACIVLSSLVPLHRQQPGSSRHPRHLYVRHTESLGATLSWNVTQEVTHVVAGQDRTDKTLAARRIPGCAVVKPLWLMECVWNFARCDEKSYLWPKTKSPGRFELQTSDASPSGEISDQREESNALSSVLIARSASGGASTSDGEGRRKDVGMEDSPTEGNDRMLTDDDDDDDDDDDLEAELEREMMEG